MYVHPGANLQHIQRMGNTLKKVSVTIVLQVVVGKDEHMSVEAKLTQQATGQ